MTDVRDQIAQLRLPRDLAATVERGWPTLGDIFKRELRPADVQYRTFLVPQSFQVTIEPSPLPDTERWAVVLLFVVDDDPLDLRLVGTFSSGPSGFEPDKALAKIKNAFPLKNWKQWALLQFVLEEIPQEGAPLAELMDWGTKVTDSLSFPTSHRRNRITPELLEEVAAIYREAWQRGKSPTLAVAEAIGKPHSTAARYVLLARKAGVLGPSDGSRGGEATRP